MQKGGLSFKIMLRSEKIAQIINKKLQTWLTTDGKLVVGIDGYAGSGKTTVADLLGKLNNDVLVVHLDDFIHHWRARKQWMDEAKDKSQVFEYKWYRYDALLQLIQEFKSKKSGAVNIKTYDFDKNDFNSGQSFNLSKKILVVDGIFLFHPEHAISKRWDKKIYLHIDFENGDKRRIDREKKKWGKDFIPDDHPGSYVGAFKTAYKRYVEQEKPQDKADLVF